MAIQNEITGLNDVQVEESRKAFGRNKIEARRENGFVRLMKRASGEPMLLLLIATSTVYFLTSSYAEGIFMLAAILIISSISFYQESRSRSALEQLKAFTQPKANVIRNGSVVQIPTEDLVVNDLFIVEEGFLIPADATVVRCNDFSVDESILTGESLSVFKSIEQEVYQGTQVMSGMAVCKAMRIGSRTRMGEIGESIQTIRESKSPLEIQIGDFVRKMAIGGGVVFAMILLINFLRSIPIRDNLLKGLTLAMSILPEEIPVAFATFMALGAWRLMKIGIIVKQTRTVETLGSATVICIDKTGTITKNEMSLASFYIHSIGKIVDTSRLEDAVDLITTAMWASEPRPFDPMEKSLHRAYEKIATRDLRKELKLTHEYPLGGVPPFMTHVFSDSDGNHLIAAKGAPESLLDLSDVSTEARKMILQALEEMAGKGFRVLGVADAVFAGNTFPRDQREFKFRFKGLVAFYDPPKENIIQVLEAFYKAGIQVKIITGDNEATTRTIARQINLKDPQKSITGKELMKYSDESLSETVHATNIFTRMFPDAKLRVIEALKRQGNIVAMTGDGVNDAPALKAAHIGIAMGKKGSEVAKQSSALILADDDLAGLVKAIGMGRQIYGNLKKAVQYIISIHIPIIMIVFIPLALGWIYPSIFTPVHIIFLELIMGPTCSIIYENEPMEENAMNEKPRRFSKTFFRMRELVTSVVQGLMITLGLLAIYWFAVRSGATLTRTTTMVFLTLVAANILLTLVNRSFAFSMGTTLRYRNWLMPLIIGVTVSLVVVIFQVPVLKTFFGFQSIGWIQFLACLATGIASVIWFEFYKVISRKY